MIRFVDLLAAVQVVDQSPRGRESLARDPGWSVEAYARALYAAADVNLNGTEHPRCAGAHEFSELQCERCGIRGSLNISILGRDEGLVITRLTTGQDADDAMAQALTEAAVADGVGIYAEGLAVTFELAKAGWMLVRTPKRPQEPTSYCVERGCALSEDHVVHQEASPHYRHPFKRTDPARGNLRLDATTERPAP